VVRELVANALTHTTDGDTPVELTVTDAPDGVSVVVADRGPGLPEREQAVLLDGDESPLRHGSGLGLWLVHIGATQLGGELTYRSREPRGAAINLRVPDHGAAMDEVS
jgi:signal transduction histidine kinase